MPPHNRTVASLSQEIGVSEATLYNWKKQFRAKGYVVPKKSTIADQWDAKAKLAAVIHTAAMNESSLKYSFQRLFVRFMPPRATASERRDCHSSGHQTGSRPRPARTGVASCPVFVNNDVRFLHAARLSL